MALVGNRRLRGTYEMRGPVPWGYFSNEYGLAVSKRVGWCFVITSAYSTFCIFQNSFIFVLCNQAFIYT